MKKNRISHSAINTYNTCGRKYKYHYIDRLRSKTISGALLMGGSIDKAINTLLETRDLEKAIKMFDKSFRYNFINNQGFAVPESTLVVYAKRDFDRDLLEKEDFEKLAELAASSKTDPGALFTEILKLKEEKGFDNLKDEDKRFYNLANWLCLRRKGHIMLKSYAEKILPKIKEVLAVQKSIAIENTDGDKITGFIDLIVEWEDGKRYVLDNKTSNIEYESDSASRSQQLIIYYHCEKEEMKLDGVGFIVMYKSIDKNKTKICSKCGNDGSGQRHKTCDAEIIISAGVGSYSIEDAEYERCNGAWIETIKPECRIVPILNQVSEAAENLVIETFDSANENIKKGAFGPNLDACEKYGMPCPYFNKCWTGKDDDLIQLESKK